DVQITIPNVAGLTGLRLLGGYDNTFTTQTFGSTIYVPQQPGNIALPDVNVFADQVTIQGFDFVFDGPGHNRPSGGILAQGPSFNLSNNAIEVGSSSSATAFDAFGFQTLAAKMNYANLVISQNTFNTIAQFASGGIDLLPGVAISV